MGGFECADHINRSGHRVDLLEETQHDLRASDDYRLLTELGIKVVREGIRWTAVEKAPGQFDFSEVRTRMLAAEELGMQVIWDLCHFGYPDDMFPTHPLFPARFSALCQAFALFHQKYSKDLLRVVPVNEISFLSWHSGDVRGTVPFAIHSGFDIKYHLCKAAIEGMKALRQSCPETEIYVVEPLVKIHAGSSGISAMELAELNSHQYQAMDMIAGRMCPELGGSLELFDIAGFNYYYNNQWNHRGQPLPWPEEEALQIPLQELLMEAYLRYRKPVVLTETGHFGTGRAQWLEEVTTECLLALSAGVDLRGICIYPVVDRPDWDELQQYHNSGIFDLDEQRNRIGHSEYMDMIRLCVEAGEEWGSPCAKKTEATVQQNFFEPNRHNPVETR